MAHTSITIVLELDDATDSPSGRASLADGTSREFRGWLGLAAAIDSLARAPMHVGASALDARERPDPTTTRKDSS